MVVVPPAIEDLWAGGHLAWCLALNRGAFLVALVSPSLVPGAGTEVFPGWGQQCPEPQTWEK